MAVSTGRFAPSARSATPATRETAGTAASSAPPPHILITGYSGFVGAYLVEACIRRYPEATLIGVSNHPPRHPLPTALTPLHADLAADSSEVIRGVIREARPDLVFHLAAQASVAASWADPAGTLATNAGGAVHLLEALRAEVPAARVVLVGSGEQYGLVPPEQNPIREDHCQQPINPYAVAKATQDLFGYQYFKAYGLPVLRVRPFNHFGPGQAPSFVVADFARQIALSELGRRERTLRVGNLSARRDFLPVEDVVQAYLAVAERGQPGQAYNVGSGQGRAIGEILDALLALARVPIALERDPTRFRPVDAPLLTADTTRLREETGWAPQVDFGAALARTLDYWREAVSRE
jgi:GDP-4-dehydro-6-deoxy-D-mannose reductase